MEAFKTSVESYLKGQGFNQIEEKVWTISKVIQKSGPTMAINGQIVQQPVEEIPMTFTVEFFGQGCQDPDTDHERPFWQLTFKQTLKGKPYMNQIEMFWPGEVDKVKYMIERALTI